MRRIIDFRGKTLEERIFLQIVAGAALAMLAITINVGIQGLIYPLFFFDVAVLLILTTFFFLARFTTKYQYLPFPFIVTVLLLIDFSWFMSMGYLGPNTYFLLGTLIIGLIILKNNQRFLFTAIVVINAVALFVIEYFNPELTIRIPFETDLIGQGIIFTVILVLISIIMIQFRNNYSNDRAHIMKMNRLIVGQKQEIELKSKALENYSVNLKREVKFQTHELASLNAELQEQRAALEQFTYILAHNIKSPIKQIQGLFNLLPADYSQDETVKETISHMKGSTDQLGDVINDLSKIVDVKKNTREIFEKVSINKQLKLALNTLELQVITSNAEIDISNVEEVHIKGINAYFQSIFYNLINNAIKYSHKDRSPNIGIVVQKQLEFVLIRVSDNGIGIDMNVAKSRIFQLYQRFNTEQEGKGFGLFLIKTQVSSMGGSIEVESEVGQGTTFTIRIPF